MRNGRGRVTEIISGFDENVSFRIDCPPEMMPAPGQYLLAYDPGEADSVLPVPLFRVGISPRATLQSVLDLPPGWGPGTTLSLRGPLGKGFDIPSDTRHLALAAFGESPARLLPLVRQSLDNSVDIALFIPAPQHPGSPSHLPPLPAALEIHPLSALPETLTWADTLALDLPMTALPTLRQTLGLDSHEHLPCQAQALIVTPMPCGAIADCGVCAVPARKGYQLACKDGPVFDLNQLKW